MPEFMLLIHESEAAGAARPPGETRQLLERQAAYALKLRASAAFVDGERLRPSAEGRRVSRDDEKGARIEAGPFDGSTLEAYYVVRASDLEAALELAAACPIPPGAELEVRPVMSGHMEPDKTSHKGRVFAFGVLGTAPDERFWIEVMDRIDERTQGSFPEHQFRGGVRLEAPSRGRHIGSAGGRRAVFDGPFLEGKEGDRRTILHAHGERGRGRGMGNCERLRRTRSTRDPGAVAELSETIADVVRREKSRVVAALVRRMGSIDAAEEAFQEAVLAALPSWRDGLPINPAAWLTTAAKNRARDDARHQRVVDTKSPLLSEHDTAQPELTDSFSDDQLRLIFTCCHPALTLDSQVALTLKVVLGLTTDEIARAFLCPEKTVSQRITRAKKTIEERRLPYDVPERLELPERLAAVLAVVYLVFNEGHTARQGSLMRLDLQTEALRLARLLCDLLPNESEVFGLFALIALALARAETRADEHGDLLLLPEQDRAPAAARRRQSAVWRCQGAPVAHVRRCYADGLRQAGRYVSRLTSSHVLPRDRASSAERRGGDSGAAEERYVEQVRSVKALAESRRENGHAGKVRSQPFEIVWITRHNDRFGECRCRHDDRIDGELRVDVLHAPERDTGSLHRAEGGDDLTCGEDLFAGIGATAPPFGNDGQGNQNPSPPAPDQLEEARCALFALFSGNERARIEDVLQNHATSRLFRRRLQ